MNPRHLSRISAMLICAFLGAFALRAPADDVIWNPPAGHSFVIDSEAYVDAQAAAPDDLTGDECGCDAEGNLIYYQYDGSDVTITDGADSDGKIDTSQLGDVEVTVAVQHKWKCPADESDTTTTDAELANPTATYKIGLYYVDAMEEEVVKNADAQFTFMNKDGEPVDADAWTGGVEDGEASNTYITSFSQIGYQAVTATKDGIDYQGYVKVVPKSIEVSITQPDDGAIVEKGTPVQFVASIDEEGAAPYTYSWTFENGEPSSLEGEEPSVSATFGDNAEGKKSTVTLTVTDSDGAVDSDSISVIVPKVSISHVTPEDLVISNSAEFYEGYGDIGFIYVAVEPEDISSAVRQDVDLIISSTEPDTSDEGTIDKDDFIEFGGPITYTAKKETKSQKCESTPELKDQTVTLKLYFKESVSDETQLTVRSVFNYLRYSKSDFTSAIEFVNAKYDIGQDATYDPSLGETGATDISLNVRVGEFAMFDENLLASTLIHERTHVEQGSLVIAYANEGSFIWNIRGGTSTPAANYTAPERDLVSIWANAEIAAYYTELNNATHTCLTGHGIGTIIDAINYYSEIDYYITNP